MNVDLTTVHQTIVMPFGATAFDEQSYTGLQGPVADSFFRSDVGIGMGTFNSQLVCDGSGNGFPQYAQAPTYATSAGDWTLEKAAWDRGCRFFMVRCWAAQQITANYTWQDGGVGTGFNNPYDPAFYSNLSGMFTTALSGALAAGVPIRCVSYMNESDLPFPGYEQAQWSTPQAITFLKNNLYPDLATWVANNPSWKTLTGLDHVEIAVGECELWSNLVGTWIPAFENDASALAKIDYYATHQYGGGQPVSAPPSPCSRPIVMTEIYDQSNGVFDASITSGIYCAQRMCDAFLNGNAAGWLYWTQNGMPFTDNEGLIGNAGGVESDANWNSPTYTKRYDALGLFSMYVKRGWRRVEVTGVPVALGALGAMAFASPDSKQCVLLLINSTGSPVNDTVTTTGLWSNTVATTRVTDATRSRVVIASAQVSGSVSISVPATSVMAIQFQPMPPRVASLSVMA